MNFAVSTDYAAIRKILTDPRCMRKMDPRPFEVGPREGLEYVLAVENNKPIGVFLILDGVELHFCFSPDVWGHTLDVARGFLDWLWSNSTANVLVGPVPKRNRLALSLALRAGFKEYGSDDQLVYLTLQRPGVA